MHESSYEREPGYALRYRDRRFQTHSGAGTDRRERRALRALLAAVPRDDTAAAPNRPWLDVPSGAGRLTEELPGPAVRVDRDPEMVRAADSRSPRACASVHALPFAASSFEGVLCMRLLQHIGSAEERTTILRELGRVSERWLIVSFFDALSLQHLRRRLRRVRRKRPSGRFAVRRSAFAAELREAGWQVLHFRPLRRFVGEQTLLLCAKAAEIETKRRR
ncbi:MAG: class I SAM-dependent methyltransferase [Planctomycetota bacterium]